MNMMSKKNYEKIAEILKSACTEGLDSFTIMYIEKELLVYFTQDNPRFDSFRFNNAIWE